MPNKTTKSKKAQKKFKRRLFFNKKALFVIAIVALIGGYWFLRNSHAAGIYMGIATSPDGQTIWKVDAGGCVNGGGALCGAQLNGPITGIANYGGNNTGYWLVGTDGGVFSYGGAPYLGSMGGKSLSKPIRAITSVPNGTGYWLLGQDGAVYSFGVSYYGGGNTTVPGVADFVSIASTSTGKGYWLVRSSGQVYAYGDAKGVINPGAGVVGIAGNGTGIGYWTLKSDGTINKSGTSPAISKLSGTYAAIARRGNNAYGCISALTSAGAITNACAKPTISISASPALNYWHMPSTIKWKSTHASSCSTNPSIGSSLSGSYITPPLIRSATYTITCKNWTQTLTKSVTAAVLSIGDLNGDEAVNVFDTSIVLARNGKTPATPADGDLNLDGIINDIDSYIVASHYTGATSIYGDLNGDNHVNVFDLSILLTYSGTSNATYAQGDLDKNGVVNNHDADIMGGIIDSWKY